jgi:hypothetical protein
LCQAYGRFGEEKPNDIESVQQKEEKIRILTFCRIPKMVQVNAFLRQSVWGFKK